MENLREKANKVLKSEFLTENQKKQLTNLLIKPTSLEVDEKIKSLINKAEDKEQKQVNSDRKEQIKDLKLKSYDEFKGLFNVYNHVKKAIKKDTLLKNNTKVLTQKFNPINVLSLIDLNTLISIHKSGHNYGTKKHFNVLTDAIIEYIELDTILQNKANKDSEVLNEFFKSESLDIGKLIDFCNDVNIEKATLNKASAKYIFENDVKLFDLLNLGELYNYEFEIGVSNARKLNGSNGVAEFIKAWDAKEKAPKLKRKVATADAKQLNV